MTIKLDEHDEDEEIDWSEDLKFMFIYEME